MSGAGARLRVSGLNAAYGQAHILTDVALEVGAGEVAALLGRNGAGKSTTFRAILGLIGENHLLRSRTITQLEPVVDAPHRLAQPFKLPLPHFVQIGPVRPRCRSLVKEHRHAEPPPDSEHR